jgi:tetratricopeptide (TPR) repeat protein
LITTRNPDLRRLATAGSIELKGMKKKEALQLLFKRAEIPTPWEKAIEDAGHDIAEALGYLALALTQAGNCISRKFCDLHNYLSYYEIYRAQHSSRKSQQKDITDDEVNVYPTFDFSLSSLQMRDTIPSKDALEILNIVAFYHFDNIRVDIFTRAIENCLRSAQQPVNISTTARTAARLGNVLQPPLILPNFLKDDPARLDQFRVRRALYELYKLSFITYTVKGEAFSLHPLIHSWARDRLDNPEKHVWAQVALNTLVASILLPPNDADDSQGSFKRDMLPHLDACLQTCSVKIGLSDTPPTRFQLTMYKFFGWSMFFIIRQQIVTAAKCGFVYASRGRFTDAAKYLTIAMESLLQLLGDRNEKTMLAMLGLAGVFWGLGRLDEAISLQKRVVQARSDVYGTQHPDTLRAMDQLGRSYWLHGHYHEALDIQQTTTEHMEKALGPEHDDTLAALDNFGVTLGSWHRYEESKRVHARVLAVREARLGSDHLDTLATMNNLAMAHLDLRNFNEAKTLMCQVYEGRRKQLGKEHPWTLWAVSNFAKVKIELGELQEAEEMLIEGIAAAKRSLGDEHLGVLMGCGELAKAYSRQGRLKEAEVLSVETVRRLELGRGMVHPDVVWARWKVAQHFERAEKYEEAINMCEIAIERAKKRLGVEHPMFRLLTNKTSALRKKIAAIEGEKEGRSLGRSPTDERNKENEEADDETLTRFLLHRSRGKKTW